MRIFKAAGGGEMSITVYPFTPDFAAEVGDVANSCEQEGVPVPA